MHSSSPCPDDDSIHGVMGVTQQVERVEIVSLTLAGSPRLSGEDPEHTRRLAEISTGLPPILVHRASMRVLDGVHRVQAARIRGQTAIEAVFFDGDADAAFVLAVRANVGHGLPLTMADRRAAAQRLLDIRPEWSDRAVAATTGLAPGTVRRLREWSSDEAPAAAARVGRDGRARPLDASAGRQRAAEVIAKRPDASLRMIARLAGVSPSTARDVRRRVSNGEDPVPNGKVQPTVPKIGPGSTHTSSPATPSLDRLSSILQGLKRDPALRYSVTGRGILHWLETHAVEPGDWSQLAGSVPPHCGYLIAELAVGCAHAWEEIARQAIARTEWTDRHP
jgi:ParB-like chromosome segregation protein Spo0J